MLKTVNCDDLHRCYEGSEEFRRSAPVRKHMVSCPACAALYGDALAPLRTAADADAPDLAALTARFDALMRDEERRRGVFEGWSTRARGLLLFAAGLLAAAAGLLRIRADIEVYPRWRLGLVLAGVTLALVLVCARALRPLYRPPPRFWSNGLLVAGALAMLLAVALLPEAVSPHPAASAGREADFWGRALLCFAWGTAVGAPLGVLLAVLQRQPQTALAFGFAVVSSSLAANWALQVHCPLTHVPHLVLGHSGTLLGLAFALQGVRLARKRYAK